MSFVGKPDPPRQHHLTDQLIAPDDEVAMAAFRDAARDELEAFLVSPATPVDQLDTKLHTEEFESVLQVKLRAILREARLANEELGINTLFLTLGSLEWSETDDRSFRAPLLFVPISLEMQANGSIRLRHEGSDMGTNLPLKAKLQELNLRLPDWEEDKSVLDYLDEVESTVRSRQDWKVHRDEVCVGFFNYEKYAMYIDLGGETWPNDRKPWDNADLQAIFSTGYPTAESSVTEQSFLDDARSVQTGREVYEADSSQTLAMVRAAEGLSIVIEGPPGTGKSQTITNIIAEAVSHGKTVLFVSAKRAALEVVKRRLTEADLGPMCLDLHDKLTNRKEFYAEIKRTVGKGVALRNEDSKISRLADLRTRLNAHSSAVNEPLSDFGTPPFAAMSELARLPNETPEDRDGRISFEQLRSFKAIDIQEALPLISALQSRLKPVGTPIDHPFWGAEIDYIDSAIRSDLRLGIAETLAKLDTAREAWMAACLPLKVQIEPRLENVKKLEDCLSCVSAAPDAEGLALRSTTWKQDEPFVRSVVASLSTRLELMAKHGGAVKPEIWSTDLTTIEASFSQFGDRWYRAINGAFRQADRALSSLLSVGAPPSPAERLPLIHDVIAVQRAEAEIRKGDQRMRGLFGSRWQGIESQPTLIQDLLDWVLLLHRCISPDKLPDGIIDYFDAPVEPAIIRDLVLQAKRDLEEAVTSLRGVLQILSLKSSLTLELNIDELSERLKLWDRSLPQLGEFIRYSEARRQALQANLSMVVELADRWALASDRLVDTFQRSYFLGVVREAMQLRPELKRFEREGHEETISEFQGLDDFKLQYNRAQVRLAHQRRLPTIENAVGNLHLLKLQCELQRKHKPIRWTMARAGEAIQQIKPVFMMSPLSIAIHLPPELPPFDIVIFDEASQIRPEDALCAISRAKQCIVVGDTRQMPPSSFFDRLVGDDDESDEEGLEIGSVARDQESILGLMSGVVLGRVRQPSLKWHYRSIHPSLIQPSNEMFYGDELVVFPSPGETQGGQRIGMMLRHHPESVYEPGSKRRVNRIEAKLVATRVLEHLLASPQESLLVAAMNRPQAELIFQEMSVLERQNPEVFARFRSRHPHEPLAVKNLETVQGDERDVVLISVTYGRDSEGVLRQQFGPLLMDGGERRLNVLFTRARRRCEVFSNFKAEELRTEGSRLGVQTLIRYLKFAEEGVTPVASETGHEQSPFVNAVIEALRSRGHEVHAPIGSGAFKIDMGVIDPADSSRYVLGIECDGPTYHLARSARDRDKLRQRVLESREWRLHRIWSQDWWQDQESEISRILDAIEASNEPSGSEDVSDASCPHEMDQGFSLESSLFEEKDRAGSLPPSTRPYGVTPLPAKLQTDDELSQFMLETVKCEGPIHREMLFLRLRSAAGYESVRQAARLRLNRIIDSNQGKVFQVSDALYFDDAQLAVPRDWSSLPSSERKTEFLTETELAAALRKIVRESYGIAKGDVASAALKLMGFKRASESAVQRVDGVLSKMISVGEIVLQTDGTLRTILP